jgi:hypothetical protein
MLFFVLILTRHLGNSPGRKTRIDRRSNDLGVSAANRASGAASETAESINSSVFANLTPTASTRRAWALQEVGITGTRKCHIARDRLPKSLKVLDKGAWRSAQVAGDSETKVGVRPVKKFPLISLQN